MTRLFFNEADAVHVYLLTQLVDLRHVLQPLGNDGFPDAVHFAFQELPSLREAVTTDS